MSITATTLPRLWAPTADEYHADATGDPRPSLSASCATTIVTRSPFHAYVEHPRLGAFKRTSTDRQDLGSLIHRLVLGNGADVVGVDADDWRTKAAKEEREAIRAAGKIPVLLGKLQAAEEMVEAIRCQLDGFGISLDGQSEGAAVWEEESSHGPVLCRGMMDHLIIDEGRIYDLKTTECAHPSAIQRCMVSRGSDIQFAAYTSAVRALRPELAGREDFVFIYVETEYPYAMTPVRPNGAMREMGAARWRRAVETWGSCLMRDTWPGYATAILDIEPPGWALHQEMMEGDL